MRVVAIIILVLGLGLSNALIPLAVPKQSQTALFSSRREFLAAIPLAVGLAMPSKAQATYTAYTRREQDWEQRLSSGDVKISSARSLRAQLREIVPQNSEGSKVFCPNGTPSNVSPLMENKCGDAVGLPSVYGRTQDVVGNSIPGFRSGYAMGGDTSSVASLPNVGGFPKY